MSGNIFYLSDLHFSHKDTLRSRTRFSSLEEMDAIMVENWRRRVNHRDTVYIVGDLFGYRPSLDVLDELTGQLILILGDHEDHWLQDIQPERYFRQVCRQLEIRDKGRLVVLSHCPLPELEPEEGYLLHGQPPQDLSLSTLRARQTVLEVSTEIAAAVTNRWGEPATLDEWLFFNMVHKSGLL